MMSVSAESDFENPTVEPNEAPELVLSYNAGIRKVVIYDLRTGAIHAMMRPSAIKTAEDLSIPPEPEPPTLPQPVPVTVPNQMDAVRDALFADPAARAAYEALSRAGGHVYAVGGAVRDAVLGKAPKDVDLMVQGLDSDTTHEALANLPGRVDLTGKNFGVYRYRVGEHEVEVALPRTEQSTGGGHKDFDVSVDHTLTPEDDLARRDFTANAMAYHVDSGETLDPYGGAEDIRNGVLRTVSPKSFKDDPLRIVRAVVAYAKHDLEPDAETIEQMREEAPQIRHLPGERIQMELDKLLSAKNPGKALELAHQAGVLRYMLPEVDTAFGVDQHNPHHELDVGSHLVEVLNGMTEISNDPDLRLAAILHDIGKPDSLWMDEQGRGHFYKHPDYPNSDNHEDVGARMARVMMQRLHFSNDRIQRVEALITHHMFPSFKTSAGARKFLQKVGDPQTAYDLVRLRMADLAGKGRHRGMEGPDAVAAEEMMRLLHEAVEEEHAFTIRDLAVNGHDLMAMGLKGPEIGRVQRELLDLVVEDPSLNDKETLLGYVARMKESSWQVTE
jgi:tRNA nucleotidyltransferase (CCA-adding enzyme)